MNDLETSAKRAGQEIHMGKTKILNNGVGSSQSVKEVLLSSKKMKVLAAADSTMYLGRLLNLRVPNRTELAHRLSQGWNKVAVFRNEMVD